MDGEISLRARRVHVGLALLIGGALLLRLAMTVFWPAPDLDPHLLVRLERFISFFTIQSNFVAFLATLAVLRGRPLDTPWGRALRLSALVGMTITCIVYVVVLSGDSTNTGMNQVTNLLLHDIGPPLFVLGWVFVGPWLSLGVRDIPRTLVWPALWILWTLIHGAITDWYPYPFIDVVVKGYGRVAVSIAFISLFAVALCLLYVWIARLRLNPRTESPAGPV